MIYRYDGVSLTPFEYYSSVSFLGNVNTLSILCSLPNEEGSGGTESNSSWRIVRMFNRIDYTGRLGEFLYVTVV